MSLPDPTERIHQLKESLRAKTAQAWERRGREHTIFDVAAAWEARHAAPQPEPAPEPAGPRAPMPDPTQGARGTSGPGQAATIGEKTAALRHATRTGHSYQDSLEFVLSGGTPAL